jgi:hypothetical protein
LTKDRKKMKLIFFVCHDTGDCSPYGATAKIPKLKYNTQHI